MKIEIDRKMPTFIVMNSFYKAVAVAAIFFLFFSGRKISTSEISSKSIISNTLATIDNIKTLRYNLKCAERIEGKIHHTESFVKLNRKPRKIYLYLKGPELLWVEGQNNGNALVNPGAFPYFNLNLDPNGSLLRKDLHHTINEIGFDYLADVIRAAILSTGDKFEKYFLYMGEEKFLDKVCYKISINNTDFTYNNYVAAKGETVLYIARKLKVSEYMILENNSFLKDYGVVKEGTKLKVPSAYAKLTVLFIDKKTNLPVHNKVYDDKGLFEEYEYHSLIVNSKIDDEEFTKDYKDYNF